MAVSTPNRSRTPLPDRTNRGAIVRATVDKLPTCACGQALDNCHAARCCPRCGGRVAVKRPVRPIPRRSTYRAEWST